MICFKGSSPWKFVILCDQSVSINIDKSWPMHMSSQFVFCNALNYCLDSKLYYRTEKSMSVFLI
jgi:hypothetical protein